MNDDPVARVRAVCERLRVNPKQPFVTTTQVQIFADDVAAAFAAKDAEIANLARWKAEALPVLHRLAEIADTVPDSTPGTRHTEIIAAELERLRAILDLRHDAFLSDARAGNLPLGPADIGMERIPPDSRAAPLLKLADDGKLWREGDA